MRVSTAALYTFAALVAHDITSQAIAATLSTDAASPISPAAPTATTAKGLTPSDLVAPIAPAESFDIELTATERIPVVQNDAPPVSVDLPTATESQPTANLVSAPAPLAEQPAAQAAPKPESPSVFSAPPAVATAVEKAAAPQPTPLVRTLNEQALLNKPESGQPGVSTHSSKVSVSHLTPEEIKALQQGLTAEQPKPTAVTPAPTRPASHTPPASLVSANLAQQATAAFGNQTATTATVAHPTANQQPAVSGAGHDANDGFSLSVYNPSDNARSYYNLTSRPDAQLSNGNVSLLFPLSIPAAITSAFGWRVHPVMGGARFHAGTDLGAPQGTPVLAALDGKVEIADFVGGYGLTVVLQHDKGTEQTLYGHLSEIFVQPGDTVKQGEAIGRVGSTGLSTGPHLHFELRKLTQEGWTVMDPGPSLEYALLHFHSPTQVAQANSGLKLPTFFQYSGKFLTDVEVATQRHTTQNPQTIASHPRANQPAIATRDRQIAATRTQPAARRSTTPQN